MASSHHIKQALANNIHHRHQRPQKTKSWKYIIARDPWPDHQNESEDADSEGSGKIRRANIMPSGYDSEEETDDAGSISKTASYRKYYEDMVNDRPPSNTNVSTWEYGIHWTRRAYSDTTRSSYRGSFGTLRETIVSQNKTNGNVCPYEVTSPLHVQLSSATKSTTSSRSQLAQTAPTSSSPANLLANYTDKEQNLPVPLVTDEAAVPTTSWYQIEDTTQIVEGSTFGANESTRFSTRSTLTVVNEPRRLKPAHYPRTSTKNQPRMMGGKDRQSPIDANHDHDIPIVEEDHSNTLPHPPKWNKIFQSPRAVQKSVRFILDGEIFPVSETDKKTQDEEFFWQPHNSLRQPLTPHTDATKRQAIYMSREFMLRQFYQNHPPDTH